MKKSKLETIIDKCVIGGEIEEAILSIKNQNLTAAVVVPDTSLRGFIKATNLDLPDSTLGIGNLQKFKSMLSIMSEDIDISLTKDDTNENFISIKFKDISSKINCSYCLADTTTINQAADLKVKLSFLSVDVSSLKKTLITAKNIISDGELSIYVENKKLNMCIGGQSDQNTNKIVFEVDCDSKIVDEFGSKVITFSAKYVREVLKTISDATSVVFDISTQGLLQINANYDNLKCTYFIAALSIK